MEDLRERIDNYFRTRTKEKRGVFKDFIHTPHTQHAIRLYENDYLNLSDHEYVVQCQVKDLQNPLNRGTMMSSFFLTDEDPHLRLEQDMGAWFGKECLLAQSGYAANSGLMYALCKPGINVYVDLFLHMSFYDGLAARRVKVHTNRPNDFHQLEANIQKHGPGMIVIESVYSTIGTFAPLEEIVRIKKQYGCVLVVDESHSFGVFDSRGFVHMKGLQDDVDFVTASLSKVYCTRAGVVFAPNALFVKENSSHSIFSSALLPNDIVRIRAMWEVVKAADDRRDKLLQVSRLFRDEVSKVARVEKIDGPHASPIISLQAKNEDEMVLLHRHLSSRGILAAPFFSPATSLRHPIVRCTFNSMITPEDVAKIVNAVAEFFTSAARL